MTLAERWSGTDRQSRAVIYASAASMAGSGLLLPFITLYLSQVRGLSLLLAGGFFTTTAISALLGSGVAGKWADQAGGRRVFHLGYWLGALASLLLLAVSGPVLVFVSGILGGFSQACRAVSTNTILSNANDDECRSTVFLLRHLAINIGFGAGAVTGAIVVASLGPSGYSVLILLDAVTFLVGSSLLRRTPAAAPDFLKGRLHVDASSYWSLLLRPVVARTLVLHFIIIAVTTSQMDLLLPLMVTGSLNLPEYWVSLAYAANTAAAVAAATVFARRGVSDRRAIRVGAAVSGGTWAVMFLADLSPALAAPALIAAALLLSVGETMEAPAIAAHLNGRVPESARGHMNGLLSFVEGGAFATGPLLTATALQTDRYGPILLALLVASLLASWAFPSSSSRASNVAALETVGSEGRRVPDEGHGG